MFFLDKHNSLVLGGTTFALSFNLILNIHEIESNKTDYRTSAILKFYKKKIVFYFLFVLLFVTGIKTLNNHLIQEEGSIENISLTIIICLHASVLPIAYIIKIKFLILRFMKNNS